jgi:flavodoxin
MIVLIVYDTVHRNTEQVAQAMARALIPDHNVHLKRAEELIRIEPREADLVIVGGPTHRQRMSARLTSIWDATEREALKGVPAAAFDTRYRMPSWLSGSAARRIAHELKKHGAQLAAPPESFFMERDVPQKGQKRRHDLERLEPGEVNRAERWAVALVESMQTLQHPKGLP